MSSVDKTISKIEVLSKLLASSIGVKQFPLLLENQFQINYLKNYLYSLRLTNIIGFFLFSGVALIIYAFFPNWQLPVAMILYVCAPLLLFLIALSYTSLYLKYLQMIMLVFSLLILICLAFIGSVAPMHLKDLVYQGMLLPTLYVTTLGHLQFRYCVCMMLVLMLSSNISYHYSGLLEAHNYYSFIVNNYLLFGGASLCLVVSYFNERFQRTQFLFVKLNRLKNYLLQQLNHQDGLTGVANRRLFDKTLEKEWLRAQRENHPLSVLFLDFDYFKQYNEFYGHTLGDKALQSLASALSSCARRSGDCVARYGGDEFVILLPNTSLDGAREFSQSIQSAIEQLRIPHEASKISEYVSTTIGIASMSPTPAVNPIELLKQADVKLNLGKRSKRNCIYY